MRGADDAIAYFDIGNAKRFENVCQRHKTLRILSLIVRAPPLRARRFMVTLPRIKPQCKMSYRVII